MDIDALRDGHIRLHRLTKADAVYTFYHDETNNVRKLHLKPGGFNVTTLKVFVLGGVVHDGPPQPLEIATLRRGLRLQKSAPELKLEHVAKGDFLTVLRSPKLTVFLRWLRDNNLLLHYHELDPLYWSIADIVDAIVFQREVGHMAAFHNDLKADLNTVLRSDLDVAADLFHRFGYPAVAPQQQREFLNALLEWLEQSEGLLPEFQHMMLKGVLQAGRGLIPLDFGVDTVPNLLIENFGTFYLNRLAIFKNSTHVLDMEPSIQAHLLETPLTMAGQPVAHYRFADSRAEPGIQLSDVVVGVLGKMHTFFTATEAKDVIAARDGLGDQALENTVLLRDLINTSDAANSAFLNHVASHQDVAKLDLFLRFSEGL